MPSSPRIIAEVGGATLDIVGAGNWGSSLAAAVPTAKVVHRAEWQAYQPGAASIWLCVADRDIPATAKELAAKVRDSGAKPKTVAHSSGALASAALSPLRELGIAVASAHPWMTFPSRRPVPLRGVWFGVEGDARAVRAMQAFVRGFGGKTFSLNAETKVFYHAFATFCSPLMVAHLAAAEAVAARAGLSPEIARKLAKILAGATLDNYAARGAEASVSGPTVRGDVETLRRHAASLRDTPERALHAALTEYAIHHLPAKDRDALQAALKGNKPR